MDKISIAEYHKLIGKKKNKYGNIKASNHRGSFDSIKEKTYEEELYLQYKAKKIKNYSCQVRFKLTINDHPLCTYIADFVVTHLDEHVEIIDVKSVATQTPVFKLKWKLLKALYPTYQYTII